jgi:outer membrane biosynthesis protein TonB
MRLAAERSGHTEAGTLQRIGWALALSAALHALGLLAIKAGPPGERGERRAALQARLETQPAQRSPQNGDVAVRAEAAAAIAQPQPAPAAEPVAHAPSPPVQHTATAEPAASLQRPEPHPIALESERPYHLITALDRPPIPLSAPDACYPRGALGEVTYELLIDEAGNVDEAAVLAVQPSGLFVAAAVELCRALRFTPGIKDGRAVRSRIRLVLGQG